jgi:hypothetical protein
MNSPALNLKLSIDSAQTSKLAASKMSNGQIAEEAFLRVYCRLPSDDEAKKAAATLPGGDNRREGVEDLFWALLNTPEFLFID